MNPGRQIIFASLFAFGVGTTGAGAVTLGDAAGRYAVGTSGSDIRFAIGNASGGGIKGEFHRFKGDVVIDGSDLSRSKVDFSLDPGSVGTGQDRVDTFLKSDAVFDAAHEKQISFRSIGIRRSGDTSAVITGQLTARGRTNTETFTAELTSLKGGNLALHVTGKVLRSRYGMDVGTPIYSNVVNFDMDLAARRR